MQRLVIPIQTEDEKQKCLQIKAKSCMFKKRLVKTWTTQQDQKLIGLYNKFPKKWNIISENMRNRNENQCLHRFRRMCQLGQNKKIWSSSQDQTVLDMIEKVGFNWKVIAQKLGTKSGKQIRQRFINKLDPNIRRQQWTQQQDLKIIKLYSKWGSKWCQISKSLSGRPQNRIKNRFYSYIQKNYQFKIKEKQISKDEQTQNKENSPIAAGVRNIQKKESESLSLEKKSSSHKVLEEKPQNSPFQCGSHIATFQNKVLQGCKQIVSQECQNSNNSMKEIEDQCFYAFKFNSTVKNDDLLYFQDN